MNIRQAILKAADSIEDHPELFNFGSVNNPDKNCGTPACALGWIRFHLHGQQWTQCLTDTAIEMGLSPKIEASTVFYSRMDEISGWIVSWRHSAKKCAKALRKYADIHHPITAQHTGIPDSVREIFQVVEAA